MHRSLYACERKSVTCRAVQLCAINEDVSSLLPIIATTAVEHIEISRVRIPAERLLDLQRPPIHAAVHVRGFRRQPCPHTRGKRGHPRRAVSTRRGADTLTSRPIRMVVAFVSRISTALPSANRKTFALKVASCEACCHVMARLHSKCSGSSLQSAVSSMSEKRESFDADAGTDGAQHFSPFQVADGESTLVLVGDQHETAST